MSVPTSSETQPTSSMLGVGLRVSAQPTNAVVVRGALKVWLATLGASEDRVFAILLAVNEAFANAVEHPRDPISTTVEIAARYDEGMVEVTVRDYGGWKKESSDAHRSAGLLLMEAFMDSVTVHSDHRGTIVLLKERLTGLYKWASSAAKPADRPTSTSTGPSRRRAARAESTLPTGPR